MGRKDPMCGSTVSTRADSCEDRWQKAGSRHPKAVLAALHKADVWKEQQCFLLPHQCRDYFHVAAVHLSSQAGLAYKSRAALSFPSTKQPRNNKKYLGSAASKCIYLLYMERGKDVEEGRRDPGWKAAQGA